MLSDFVLAGTKNLSFKTAKHLSDVLFEIFSAFFDAGGLAPIKAKKAKIAGRVRRQAIEVRFLSAYVFLCQPAFRSGFFMLCMSFMKLFLHGA